MKTWVKLYTEIIDDPKMARLSWEERGIWSALLALAGRIEDRNGDGMESGKLARADDIAWYLRTDAETLQHALTHFSDLDMAHADEDGMWFIVHWQKRQARPPSDNPEAWRDRQQKHREVTRQDKTTSRDCHDDVTSLDKIRLDKKREEREEQSGAAENETPLPLSGKDTRRERSRLVKDWRAYLGTVFENYPTILREVNQLQLIERDNGTWIVRHNAMILDTIHARLPGLYDRMAEHCRFVA